MNQQNFCFSSEQYPCFLKGCIIFFRLTVSNLRNNNDRENTPPQQQKIVVGADMSNFVKKLEGRAFSPDELNDMLQDYIAGSTQSQSLGLSPGEESTFENMLFSPGEDDDADSLDLGFSPNPVGSSLGSSSPFSNSEGSEPLTPRSPLLLASPRSAGEMLTPRRKLALGSSRKKLRAAKKEKKKDKPIKIEGQEGRFIERYHLADPPVCESDSDADVNDSTGSRHSEPQDEEESAAVLDCSAKTDENDDVHDCSIKTDDDHSSGSREGSTKEDSQGTRLRKEKIIEETKARPKVKIKTKFGPTPQNCLRFEWEGGVVVQILEKVKTKRKRKDDPTEIPQLYLLITRDEDTRPWTNYGIVGNSLCKPHRLFYDYILAPPEGSAAFYNFDDLTRCWQDGNRRVEFEFSGDYRWPRVTITVPERLGSNEKTSATRLWSAIEKLSRRLGKANHLENKLPPVVALDYVPTNTYTQLTVEWAQRILTCYILLAAIFEIYKLYNDFTWIFILVGNLLNYILHFPMGIVRGFIFLCNEFFMSWVWIILDEFGLREAAMQLLQLGNDGFDQIIAFIWQVLGLPFATLEWLDAAFGVKNFLVVDVVRRQFHRVVQGLMPIWWLIRTLSSLVGTFLWSFISLFSTFRASFVGLFRASESARTTGAEVGRLTALAVWSFERIRALVRGLFQPIYNLGVKSNQMKNWIYLWAAARLKLPHCESPFPTLRRWMYSIFMYCYENTIRFFQYLWRRTFELGPFGVVKSSTKNLIRFIWWIVFGTLWRMPKFILYTCLYRGVSNSITYTANTRPVLALRHFASEIPLLINDSREVVRHKGLGATILSCVLYPFALVWNIVLSLLQNLTTERGGWRQYLVFGTLLQFLLLLMFLQTAGVYDVLDGPMNSMLADPMSLPIQTIRSWFKKGIVLISLCFFSIHFVFSFCCSNDFLLSNFQFCFLGSLNN